MCFIVNGTSSVREFLNTTFLKLYLMQTSRKQISMFTEEEFQSCQAASLVNPIQVLESDSEKRMNATCGPKCLEQFEKFNHVGSWAKTFSALLIGMGGWYSKRCKLTWKLKGTKSNRLYFQLQASTLPTEEIECGLLLTPTSVMTDEPPEKMRERAERNGYKNGTQYGSLLSQVKYSGMLPTPTCSDSNGSGSAEALKKRGRGERNDLGSWATLNTDGKNSQLNPQFVAEMMGFPTDWTISPFLSGETNPSKPTETQ
jgi:hypothetical protein